MSLSPREYLRHILNEVEYLLAAGHDINQTEFMRDETLKRAFVRSIEIIGEASKKIPYDFRQKYPHIQWREMAGMRDRLIHSYFGIDYDIVWDVVRNKIPSLRHKIATILLSEDSD